MTIIQNYNNYDRFWQHVKKNHTNNGYLFKKKPKSIIIKLMYFTI